MNRIFGLVVASACLVTIFLGSLWARSGDEPTLFDRAWRVVNEAGSLEELSRTAGDLERALTRFKRQRDLSGQQKTLYALGLVNHSLGRYSQAERSHTGALDAAGKLPPSDEVARTVDEQGVRLESLGQMKQAAHYYKAAAQIARRLFDSALEIESMRRHAAVGLRLADYPEAMTSLERALALAQAKGAGQDGAKTLVEIGDAYATAGKLSQAQESYNEAMKQATRITDKGLESDALGKLAGVFRLTGTPAKAIEYLEKSLQVADKRDADRRGPVLVQLGRMYRDMGRYSDAAACYDGAEQLVHESRNVRIEPDLLASVGELYEDWGYMARAMSSYGRALELSGKLDDRTAQGRILLRMARVQADAGNVAKAIEAVQEAKAILMRAGERTSEADDLMAGLYLDLKQVDRAEPLVRISRSDAVHGRFHLTKGDYPMARRFYENLLKTGEMTARTDDLFTAYTGLGIICEATNDLTKAAAYYSKAGDLVEDLRGSLLAAARKRFFTVKTNGFSRLEPTRGVLRVMMKQGKWKETIAISDLTKAREFADKLAHFTQRGYSGVPKPVLEQEQALVSAVAWLKELRDCCSRRSDPKRWDTLNAELQKAQAERDRFIEMLWQDYRPYAAVKYPRPVSLEQLELGGRYALVYDILGDWVGVKLLKGKEVVAASLTELNAEELEGMVNRFRKPFDTAAFSDFDPKLARSLYEKLLEPVVNKVPSGAPIVVVPDGVMAMLPFEALVVKGEARWVEAPWGGYNVEGLTYFGDLHPISYAQSLTALALLDQKLKAGRKASSGVLIIADPVFSRADERVRDTKEPISPSSETQPTSPALLGPDKQGASDLEFTRLMETEKLADFLGELFQRDAAVYSGLKADKEIFLSDIAPALDRFRFVVFGTHGVYTTELPGIMEPILALTTWPPGKDGLLRMTEVMSLEMTAELVALTACQTGLGSQVSGEGIMSMGRAFLFAGAGSVLMTLWSVDETASVKLVEAFFRQMQGGQTATQALLAARSDLRRAGYDHPFFWGAFILVGLAD